MHINFFAAEAGKRRLRHWDASGNWRSFGATFAMLRQLLTDLCGSPLGKQTDHIAQRRPLVFSTFTVASVEDSRAADTTPPRSGILLRHASPSRKRHAILQMSQSAGGGSASLGITWRKIMAAKKIGRCGQDGTASSTVCSQDQHQTKACQVATLCSDSSRYLPR